MTVAKVLEYIDFHIEQTVQEYALTNKSKDDSGTYIPHSIESKTEAHKLMAIDYALRDVALNTVPLELLESVGSTADEFKRISDFEYIRTPNTPQVDGELDIDESLSFAVIYRALSVLWSGYSILSSQAEQIFARHNDATRSYFLSREQDDIQERAVYFRYSSDGASWHDTFADGDIYISFKQGDGVWSHAIKFVGEDGAAGTGDGGSGATTFKELTDTPSTLTEGKFLAVGANETVVEVDAPSGGSQEQPFSGDATNGIYFKDFTEIVGNYYYLEVLGDTTIDIPQTDGKYNIELGKLYTIEIIPNGHAVTLDFNALGNKTIDPNADIVMIDILFDSLDILIMENRSFSW